MSDLLNKASLVMVPSGYKEDTVYSVIPTDGSGDLSFTRASNGTRINSAGLVEVCPWNLLQYSNTFSNAIWTKGSTISVTSGQTGYDGSSNAWLLSKNAIQYPALGQSLVNSGFTTLSVYAKANTNTNICLFASSSPSNKYQDFNLSNGTLGTNASGVVNATITSVGNGWYFCVVTFNGNTTTFDIFPDIIDGANAGSIYIQNAQLNIGSTAKPYFPTTDRLNVPRLTYQNGGGGCPSLLLEKQSTNLVTYSEQFDNGAWPKQNLTVTSNATTSPDGTQNADKLVADTTNARHLLYEGSSLSANTYTFTTYAKAGENSFLIMRLDTDSPEVKTWFDLSNGTIGTSQGGSPTITSVGNGWYRCSVQYVSSTTQTLYAVLYTAKTNGGENFAGNGTDGTYVWGAQLEASSYATSYIPTTSSSATRVADACYKTGISNLIGQTSGSVFLDFTVDTISGQTNDPVLWYMKDGGSGERYVELFSNGNLLYIEYDGSAVIASITKTGLTVGRHKCAIAYAPNDMTFYVDGVQIGTDTSGTPSGLSTFGFQYYNSAFNGQQRVNNVQIFQTRLTNAELASLTTL